MQIGDLVRSVRGRDSGRVFLVVGERVGRVLVADGDVHPVDRPKAKNLRHVEHCGSAPPQLQERLLAGHQPNDAEVRTMIQSMLEGGDAGAEG